MYTKQLEVNMRFLFILFLVFQSFIQAQTLKEKQLFELLKTDNHFAMIRHAYAPGFGDPVNFDINIKNTQRNLNKTGMKQAENIGKLFKKNEIIDADIYSSYWFRCYETAKLMDLGEVTKIGGLNSFYEDHFDKKQTANILKKWLATKEIKKPLILVTHQVNISNLTNRYANSGEIVIVKKLNNDKFEVAGSIATLKN